MDMPHFYLPVYGHLNGFHFLAVMDNAAMKICAQVAVWAYVFNYIGYILRSGITGSHGNSLTIQGTANWFP